MQEYWWVQSDFGNVTYNVWGVCYIFATISMGSAALEKQNISLKNLTMWYKLKKEGWEGNWGMITTSIDFYTGPYETLVLIMKYFILISYLTKWDIGYIIDLYITRKKAHLFSPRSATNFFETIQGNVKFYLCEWKKVCNKQNYDICFPVDKYHEIEIRLCVV